MRETVDICVVGGGIVGLYCAAELARAGLQVRLIDKAYSGLNRDAAGDITQHGHAPGYEDGMADFVRHTINCWKKAMDEFGEGMGLMPCGSITFATTEADQNRLLAEQVTDAQHRMASHWLAGKAEVESFLGGIKLGDAVRGVKFNSNDMAVDTHTVMDTLRRQLVNYGVRVWGSDVAKEFLVNMFGDVCGVRTEAGDECLAKHTLVCAGMFAGQLLKPLGVNLPLRPVRCHVAEVERFGHLPVAVVVQPMERGYLRIRRLNEKRALVAYDGMFDPAQTTFSKVVDDATVAWMMAEAGKLLPALHNATVHEVHTFPMAMTPDMAPAVGTYPKRKGLLIAAGMCGYSYAYAAGVADVLVRLVNGDEVELGAIAADRFATGKWSSLEFK
ncbi:MAG: FAD-binding oxidoreductase, partial [Alphaproteobacteria bacterium]